MFKTHNTQDCKKKERYEKLLSGGVASRQKATKEFSHADKKLRREFKLMAKKVQKLEKTRQSKRNNLEGSDGSSSSDESF